MTARQILKYCKDIRRYAWDYPWGIFHPRIVWGYFDDGDHAPYQRRFFNELRKDGFRRTPWQLVLPGQTAGLIKTIEPLQNGANQYHVRFYRDGTIDCEIEYSNFNTRHWTGERLDSKQFLEDFLTARRDTFQEAEHERIGCLFGLYEIPWEVE